MEGVDRIKEEMQRFSTPHLQIYSLWRWELYVMEIFKMWNLEVFGWIDLEVEDGKTEINELDDLLISFNKDKVDELVIRRCNNTSLMWKKLGMKQNMILQKYRLKWTREGDMISKYGLVDLATRSKKD